MSDNIPITPARGEETFLLIGNGIAALAAAEEIRRIHPRAAIVMIGEEDALPYRRTALSKELFLPHLGDRLAIHPPAWYSRQGIFLLSGRRVTRLLPRAKQVELANGALLDYDKCILATGSQCVIPSIEGRTLPGVFTLHALADFEAIARAARPDRRAVIIGSDPWGLEAAWQLYLGGCHVTVLEASDRLFCGQASYELTEEIIRAAAGREVDIRVGIPVSRLEGDGEVEQVILPGEYLSADLVLFAYGSRPRIELAQDAGLEVDKGILVNARMMTDKYGIYACGNCAQIGREIGCGHLTAQAMGCCAGRNAAGEDALYTPPPVEIVIEAFGQVLRERPREPASAAPAPHSRDF